MPFDTIEKSLNFFTDQHHSSHYHSGEVACLGSLSFLGFFLGLVFYIFFKT